MVTQRWVAVTIVLSLVLGTLPRPAWAADTEIARTQPSINLRAAADVAAARLARETPQRRTSAAAGGGQMVGAGGGGKGMMIMTLVMTVVGVGATYYMVKEMQKQTDQSGK